MLKPFVSEKFWKKLHYVDNKDTLCLALEMRPKEFSFFESSLPRFSITPRGAAPATGNHTAATRVQKVVRGWLARRYMREVRKAAMLDDHIQRHLSFGMTVGCHYVDWSTEVKHDVQP